MEKKHVCPWWLGYLLLIPFRRLRHNPEKILETYIKPGMTVIDYGSAMGYFSLPMARMVGNEGKVFCFDIQEKMLEKLVKRARKSGLENIIKPMLVENNETSDGINGTADFALLFFVAHEVPDQNLLFRNLAAMLKPGALLLFAEPAGHVKLSDFEQSVSYAEKSGFAKSKLLKIGKNYSILFEKI
jgi:2-polyprenyl-3-methyl-5-hydroxy-6-metoxy-1,4-benzoquinol methylase